MFVQFPYKFLNPPNIPNVPWIETLRTTKMVDILKRTLEMAIVRDRKYIFKLVNLYETRQKEHV